MIPIYIIKAPVIFITTYIGTLLVLPKLIHIASTWVVTKKGYSDERYSLMDIPDNRRKVHNVPKPIVGGIGMLMLVSLSSLIFVHPTDLNLRGYYSSVILLGIVGFLDDFSDLHYRWKFIAQLIASVIMINYSKTMLQSFGDIVFLGPIDLGIFAVPVTIFCTLGVINSFNMIDGLDGLAGGISLIAFLSFAFLAYISGKMALMLLSISLFGAVLGFLRYNWFPAKLFMGDAGSFFLGFSLTFLSIDITQNNSPIPPVAALLILTVPVVDTITVMIRRMLKGKNPFVADKTHVHHLLLKFGLDAKGSVKIILVISGAFSLFGVLGAIFKTPEHYLFLIFLAYFFLYFIVSLYLEKSKG